MRHALLTVVRAHSVDDGLHVQTSERRPFRGGRAHGVTGFAAIIDARERLREPSPQLSQLVAARARDGTVDSAAALAASIRGVDNRAAFIGDNVAEREADLAAVLQVILGNDLKIAAARW